MVMKIVKNRVHLLGPVLIQQDGQVVETLKSRKGLALLAYLSQHPEPVSRAYLADLLWPDKLESRGKRNLSRELSQLTGYLGPCFRADYHTIQFDPVADFWLDTAVVTQLYQEGRHADFEPNLSQLVEAVSLYRGSFMDGFVLDGCPDFEVWLIRQQEKWQQLIADMLTRLADHYAQHKEFEQAEIFLRHWLTIQPWQEQAHLQLISLLARSGRPGTALAQYEICRRILAEELDVAPPAQLVALIQQIQADRLSQDEILLPFDPRPPASPPPCPYQGLAAFSQTEADFFFGREAFVQRLLEMMRQKTLVAVVGPSGSGKSSVVLAGLLGHLNQHPTPSAPNPPEPPHNWLPVIIRPGVDPCRRLNDELHVLLAAPNGGVSAGSQTTGAAPPSPATLIASILAQAPAGTRLLLVVDQFEELYTLCSSPESRQEFLDTLLLLANLPQPARNETPAHNRGQVTVILTLRADFMGQALTYRPLADALQNADIKLGPMTTAELRRAIIQPAAHQGLAMEAGLVERLLNDVGHDPGYLPLLQFTLTVLWDRQQAGQLTYAAYQAVGGVDGTLTRYADSVYTSLNPDQQREAEQIFTHLISPGEGTEATRRRANLDDLSETGRQVVETLVKARLLVIDRAGNGPKTVEIAHEALIRGWEQLRIWLNQDRTFLVWKEQLRYALRRWENSNHDDGSLLRGVWLAEAEQWLATRPNDLTPTEHTFINAGIVRRDRHVRAVEAQRQRELAQAQALAQAEYRRAEMQTRAGRRLRWLASGLAAVLVVAVILGLLAWQAQQQAEEAAAVAQSLNLSTNARLALNQNNTDLALALALAANRLDNPPRQAQLTLAEVAYAPGTRRLFTGHQGPVQGVAISPDGKTALSAAADQTPAPVGSGERRDAAHLQRPHRRRQQRGDQPGWQNRPVRRCRPKPAPVGSGERRDAAHLQRPYRRR
jgi:DNA-binding SARP family transcriptional activator